MPRWATGMDEASETTRWLWVPDPGAQRCLAQNCSCLLPAWRRVQTAVTWGRGPSQWCILGCLDSEMLVITLKKLGWRPSGTCRACGWALTYGRFSG